MMEDLRRQHETLRREFKKARKEARKKEVKVKENWRPRYMMFLLFRV